MTIDELIVLPMSNLRSMETNLNTITIVMGVNTSRETYALLNKVRAVINLRRARREIDELRKEEAKEED